MTAGQVATLHKVASFLARLGECDPGGQYAGWALELRELATEHSLDGLLASRTPHEPLGQGLGLVAGERRYSSSWLHERPFDYSQCAPQGDEPGGYDLAGNFLGAHENERGL